MNSNSENGNRGEHIKPAPRPSIHEHCGNCQFHESMGRYGVNSRDRPQSPKQNIGFDVVDNALSKMAEPINQKYLNNSDASKRKQEGRYSSDEAISDCSEDSEVENVLSKLCPADFSSYYRGASFISASEREYNVNGNGSQTSTTIENNSSRCTITTCGDKFNAKSERNMLKQSVAVLSVIALAYSVMACLSPASVDTNYNIHIYNEFDFFKDIKSLETKYKVSKDSLLQIRSGISNIFNKKYTGSFIFLYNSATENYDPSVFNSFMGEIATNTVRYLRNNTDQTNHVVVDTRNIQTDVQLMDAYGAAVDRAGVMVVPDVNRVPSGVAMAFHYYCDEYNPLVKTSAVFFTLDAATCNNFFDDKPTHQLIEKCLSKDWNNIHEDKIGPLLTRVVNVIIDVRNIA